MMKQYQIEAYKRNYPAGTRVELNAMDGEGDMPKGLQGSVAFVDDAGQIHVDWDNGRTLALIPEADSFSKLPEAEPEQTQGNTQTMGGM